MDQEEIIQEDSTQKEKEYLPKNQFLIPLSIIIAGALIAGALLYNGKIGAINASSTTPASSSTAAVSTASESTNLVNIAKSIGLNTSKFNQCTSANPYTSLISNEMNLGNQIGVNGTPTLLIGTIDHTHNTVTGVTIPGAYPFATFQSALNVYLSGNGDSFKPTDTSIVSTTKVTISLTNAEERGDKNAKVAFVEFGDYQCPYCGSLESNTMPQITGNYIQTNKVLQAFIDFPLTTIHPNAMDRAIAARCAGAQGKYWQMHDALYANQSTLNGSA